MQVHDLLEECRRQFQENPQHKADLQTAMIKILRIRKVPGF